MGASLIPHSCIDGVGIWDRPAQVLRSWGAPSRVTRSSPPGGPVFITWHYPKREVTLVRWDDPPPDVLIVLSVSSTASSARTTAGVGVGSTIKQLRAAFPRVYCDSPRRCGTQGTSNGVSTGQYTHFDLKDGRVVEVSIDVDSSYVRQLQTPRGSTIPA